MGCQVEIVVLLFKEVCVPIYKLQEDAFFLSHKFHYPCFSFHVDVLFVVQVKMQRLGKTQGDSNPIFFNAC